MRAPGADVIELEPESALGMRVGRARHTAESAHWGSVETSGEKVIAHVRRVAEAAPESARSVAWLHEVFECSSVSEEELLASGLTTEELRALRLLTRQTRTRSEAQYLAHIELIARSSGRAGELARIVKRFDLADRVEHPHRRPDGWHPPYQVALELLRKAIRTPGPNHKLPQPQAETAKPHPRLEPCPPLPPNPDRLPK
jgi:hypothetical protein